VAQSLEHQINKNRQFINLESALDNSPKVADLGNGVLAFISTKIQSQAELHQELSNLCKQLPKQYKVAGLDLQLYYRYSITEPVNDDGFDIWLQRGYLGLSQKQHNIDFTTPHIDMDVSLAAELQQAMRSNTLAIYLQPIINLRNGTICGAEALLRWPTAGKYLDIEQLILLAERTGLINELSLWVIDQACLAAAQLNRQGYREHTISVNLSAKNLAIPKLVEKVENTILKHGITADQLKFELTEFALIKNHDEMVSFISELNKLGSKVVLDDFGTGYSSLNYLVNYSFSTIKVDKSFILDLVNNTTNQVVVKTAIDMAHNLDMNITIEGIEDQETEKMLIKMGADQGQGYYYSKAVPINEYLSFIASQFK
jgi:EAL domain-containing protein (putative c-di-GMP-specific phosphodiesterase class I)